MILTVIFGRIAFKQLLKISIPFHPTPHRDSHWLIHVDPCFMFGYGSGTAGTQTVPQFIAGDMGWLMDGYSPSMTGKHLRPIPMRSSPVHPKGIQKRRQRLIDQTLQLTGFHTGQPQEKRCIARGLMLPFSNINRIIYYI